MKITHIKFAENVKKYVCISAAVILIGIICNFVFGVHLDIQFTGGTILSYNYQGDIEENELKAFAQEITDDRITMTLSKNFAGNGNVLSLQLPGDDTITPEGQKEITTKLQEKYADNNFTLSESSSVEPTMGLMFFLKCLCAIAIAAVIIVIYVAIRFKKIGGLSAGCMALVALCQDIVIVYFTFVILRLPIDSNFMAVILMILGYSINDTIVIYDRVRENRRLMGKHATNAEVFNKSANQMLKRTIFTSLTTIMAIGTVLVVSIAMGIDSVRSFALPMMLGVVYGCYSSNCIAGPLWVAWQNHKDKKAAANG
ncbi:MAG: protein translocase subunit SecF [Clostridiales bacterium]|nr:protein translocase subunit SecF [Clostridiales bacterium]